MTDAAKPLVGLLSVVILCVTAACRQRSAPLSDAAEPTPRPMSLVATLGDRLAVLSSVDGTASYLTGRFTDVSRLAVSADGRLVIVVNGSRDCRTTGGFEEGSYQPEIDWVEIASGARERVVGGSDFPAVNGKQVTFLGLESQNATALVAYGGVCDGNGSVGFTDMVTGQNARRSPFGEDVSKLSTVVGPVRPLGWLSDGSTLFYAVSVRGEAYPQYYFGRLWPLVTPADEAIRRVAATLHESSPAPTAEALVDDTTIAFAHDTAAGSRVRQWDVSTGRFAGAEQSVNLPETVTALSVDSSGTHFLAVARGRALYRWSVGDAAPIRLADNVSAAAWLR